MFKHELQKLENQGLLRKLRQVDSAQGPRIILKAKEVINLCSNDYLGLANHLLLKEAAKKALDTYGTGSAASRLISGTTQLHKELEKRIARFKKTEAALVFNSGYSANLGIITALVDREDIIFSDKLNHASIVDGCLLSGAEFKRYPHKDINALEKMLQESINHRRRLIITDTIFSMDGDIAPLLEIVELAKKYDCMLMLDEAHATGVFGEHGCGVFEHFKLENRDHIIHMGTLSKALGSFGAYVAGSKDLIEYIINKSRPFIYTTALPAYVIAASIAALDIIEKQPDLRKKLWDNVNFFKQGLEKININTMQSQSQIIPILIGDNDKAVKISNRLLEVGIFIQAIRPPTVPKGQARLRVTIMATHTKKDLEIALDKLNKLGKL